jgi:CRISPR-associated protein Csx17
MQTIILDGCTPTPIAAYLKALGILRLVSEQVDPSARGHWLNHVFRLSSSLDSGALVGFFLDRYRPSPIIAPWNGGSGFYPKKSATLALSAIADSTTPRLADYRATIEAARGVIRDLRLTAKPNTKQKQELMRLCRSDLPDAAVQWIDTAYILGQDKPRYPALLGTGANDGNLDFTANFMQNLLVAIDVGSSFGEERTSRSRGHDREVSEQFLRDALFGTATAPLLTSTAGQYNPGAVGGPNSTRGFEGRALLNPWDFILTLEGSLVFAGSVVWRLNAASRGMAAFPFTVEASASGWGTAGQDAAEARAEMWMPLWDRPASYREIMRLFSEGRAQVGRRRASTGTDFARAIAGLGVDRGITEFVRYGFMRRSGLAYLSVPLGQIRVAERPTAHLLRDLDPWLDSLKRLASAEGPDTYKRAIRQIEDRIFAFCNTGSTRDLIAVLRAVGRAERALATGSRSRRTAMPLQRLRPDWADKCCDSVEFRLALALASISHPKIGSIRCNLEPVKQEGDRWRWVAGAPTALASGTDLVRILASILERRLMDGAREGVGELPIEGAFEVPLSDLVLFLRGQTDDGEVLDLLWALGAMMMDRGVLSNVAKRTVSSKTEAASVPGAYALLKLLMLPEKSFKRVRSLARLDPETRIRPEPAILSRLRALDPQSAVEIAVRRLRTLGIMPLASGRAGDMRVPTFVMDRDEVDRLAAALLVPVTGVDYLYRFVIRPSASHQ